MTKSEIFKLAHKIAKSTVKIVGDYMVAFSLALKEIYKTGDSFATMVAAFGIGLISGMGNKALMHTYIKEAAELFIANTEVKAGKIWQDVGYCFYIYK